MKSVLSTKVLSLSQKALLSDFKINLVEYDAIAIKFIDFEIIGEYENYIFTSKNAVKAFLDKGKKGKINCFCVGEKTKALLDENDYKVVKMAENAADLADFIAKYHSNTSFLFLAGNKRRNDLPSILTEKGISFKEIICYETLLIPKKFEQHFDAILFFSPSGIKSYVMENTIGDSKLFCIGRTTASEAKNYTVDINIAKKPIIDEVINTLTTFLK